MKTMIHYAFVLLAISAVACAILAVVNHQTAPLIAENKVRTENEARQEMFPGAVITMTDVDPDYIYYEAKDHQGNLLGYIINAEGKGYSSTIKAIIGVSADYTIQKIKILEQQETPGLGTNCEKPEFLQRFTGKKPGENDLSKGWSLKVDKDGGEIQSISGATITSRAVTKAIKESVDKLTAKTYAYIDFGETPFEDTFETLEPKLPIVDIIFIDDPEYPDGLPEILYEEEV